MKSFTLYSDDSLSQVYESTRISRKGEIFEDIAKQKQTIKFSVGLGHESVLEHTNLIMGFELDKDEINSKLNDVLETCHYLHYRFYPYDNSSKILLIIAGSIRGYKHIFRNIKDMNNTYLKAIKQELYENSYSDFFRDFIDDGIMDETKFTPYIGKKYPVVVLPNGDTAAVKNAHKKIDDFIVKDRVAVLWYDDIHEISDNILKATGITIPLVDLFEFCTIGIKIWCSRTASHQIVRHRNGITQESQRYCNYTKDIAAAKTNNDLLNTMFVDPCWEDFIAELGGPIKYKTVDKNSEKYQELWNKYIDNNSHKRLMLAACDAFEAYKSIEETKQLRAEDVRAILPGNTKTSLIMTFTYRNLIKAIELRVDKAAQAEIRNIFICIEDILKSKILKLTDDIDLNTFICPCGANNYYCDLNVVSAAVMEDEVSEPVGDVSTKVIDQLTDNEKTELKKDLDNEFGMDIDKFMKNTPKDIFTRNTDDLNSDPCFLIASKSNKNVHKQSFEF